MSSALHDEDRAGPWLIATGWVGFFTAKYLTEKEREGYQFVQAIPDKDDRLRVWFRKRDEPQIQVVVPAIEPEKPPDDLDEKTEGAEREVRALPIKGSAP